MAQEQLFEVTGRFFGSSPTVTERESGTIIEVENLGPLKPGGAGHSVLQVFGDGRRRTAYDASFDAIGDYHGRRRETRRLFDRGYLEKNGVLPNAAKNGRPRVDAFQITIDGRVALDRLDRELDSLA